MVEQAHLFLQLKGVVLKVVLFNDVLSLDSFDVVEEVLAMSEHLGGVVEVDANHVVAQGIPYSVFRGVVDPFLNCHVY